GPRRGPPRSLEVRRLLPGARRDPAGGTPRRPAPGRRCRRPRRHRRAGPRHRGRHPRRRRRRPPRAARPPDPGRGRHRLRPLHLRLDRPAQGRRRAPPRSRQLPALGRPPAAPVHSSGPVDLTVTSLWLPRTAGGTIRLVDEADPLDGLVSGLTGPARPTLVKLTPSHLQALCRLLPEGGLADLDACFVVGGEALSPVLVDQFRALAPAATVVNEYGPTETVVGCAVHTLAPGEAVPDRPGIPAGRPIAGTCLYVLDERMVPVPVGVPGELFIGGVQVAWGYLGDPVKTAGAFVPDPFGAVPGARLYRTGDVVRYLPGGELEFLGRRDHQVKIRGQRIELGEVENAL